MVLSSSKPDLLAPRRWKHSRPLHSALLVTAIHLALLSTPSHAQYPPDLDQGQRVRLRDGSTQEWIQGEYVYGEPGSVHVLLQSPRRVETLNLSEVDSLEAWTVSGDRGSRVAIGAAIGGAAGFALGLKANADVEDDQDIVHLGAIVIPLLTVMGVALGAGIAATLPDAEGWRGIPLYESDRPGAAEVTLLPEPARGRLSLAWTF